MHQIRLDLPHVSLAALTWGPTDGRLAVLLHGFPDTAYTWRHLGPELAAAGFRVIAPFLRGYAPSSVPDDGSGHVAALVDDAVRVHDQLGGGPDAVLVGHDWGAITANALAAHPDCPYARVVSLAVPPLPAMRSAAALRALPRQLRNSWYVAFNQLPLLPERTLARVAPRLWHDWSPGYDAAEDLRHLDDALPDDAHRSAVIGYYRAFVRPLPPPQHYRRWQGAEMRLPVVPTLPLHGAEDGALDARLTAAVSTIVPGAGHFLHLERPDEVNRRILDFLR